MSNRTPDPAPSGYKWVISQSILGDPGEYLELGLWPLLAQPDEYGIALSMPPHGLAKGPRLPRRATQWRLFKKERQLRRTSRIILRSFHRDETRRRYADRMTGLLTSEWSAA